MVSLPELIVQEIIDEEIPFSEILSKPPLIMTVAEDTCTLTVPELLAASLRDHARDSTPLLKVCSPENELLQGGYDYGEPAPVPCSAPRFLSVVDVGVWESPGEVLSCE
jgi:hypothetical protein